MARPTVTHDVFTAISDPTRRRMLDLLRAGDLTVTELAASLPVSQPTISEHLRVLRNVGLVAVQRAGRQRIYRAQESGLDEVRAWLDGGCESSEAAYPPVAAPPHRTWSPEID